jgi:hypothetical protein
MQKTLLRTLVCAAVLTLVGAGIATALVIRAGNIIVIGDGGFSPTKLPRDHYAPITIKGHGLIKTSDGTLPPILKSITFYFDKHGAVVTEGLPVCNKNQLLATDVEQARKACPDSIVGSGFGAGVVNFPEQAPIEASSPITIFNGPVKHGNPTVWAHAYLTVGGPSTILIPVEIQKINKGRYGFKTVAEIPKLVNGYGTPTSGRLKIGKRWVYKGKKLSYVNASCPDGHLQAEGQFGFNDGSLLKGTFLKPCTPLH